MQNYENNLDEKKRKSPKRKRNKAVTLRLSEDEFLYLNERIKSSGLTQSDFIRQASLRGKIADPKLIINLTNQIKKIGTNVNQIAKFANIKNDVTVDMLKNLDTQFKEIEKIWEQLKQSPQKPDEQDR